MIITDIIKEKKHLCRILFDDGREALLDADTVSVCCIHKEDAITEEKLSAIIEESNYNRAKNRALWYLDTRSFTEKGLYSKLLEKGFDKWIFIEHDTHLREPLEDLAESREILRKWGI